MKNSLFDVICKVFLLVLGLWICVSIYKITDCLMLNSKMETIYGTMDVEQMNEDEERDYAYACAVFDSIYANNGEKEYFKSEPYTVYDMKYKIVMKNGNVHQYIGELKSKNQNWDRFNELPIKVDKYCNLKDAKKPWEKLFYLVFTNNEEYYLFDLEKLDLNKCRIVNWPINKIQRTNGKKKIVPTPTIFIPVEQARLKGKIPEEIKKKYEKR